MPDNGSVRRTILLVLAWVCGTAVAVGSATAAINLVGDRVTNRPLGTVSDAAIAVELAASTTTAASAPAPGASDTSPPTSRSGAESIPPALPAVPETTQPPAASSAKTFELRGGRVNATCTSSVIQLVWATPNAGYQVEIQKSGPDEIEVRFRTDEHESRVRARCSAGLPTGELREDDHG